MSTSISATLSASMAAAADSLSDQQISEFREAFCLINKNSDGMYMIWMLYMLYYVIIVALNGYWWNNVALDLKWN